MTAPSRRGLRHLTGPSRRQVLRGGCAAGAACLVAGCGGADGPELTAEADGTVRIPAADVGVGSPTYHPGVHIIVSQPVEGDYRAFDATCPHQGCRVSGTGPDGQLVCPCHDSTFDPATGEVLSGPATSGLTALTVRTDGADLVIRG